MADDAGKNIPQFTSDPEFSPTATQVIALVFGPMRAGVDAAFAPAAVLPACPVPHSSRSGAPTFRIRNALPLLQMS
jgi:hypothetical protein